MGKEQSESDTRQRIDKWLFFARLAKSRSLAQARISSGHIKVNGVVTNQPSRLIGPGDRIDLAMDRRDMTVVVRQAGARRGPFEEARHLYEDVTPPEAETKRLSLYEQAVRAPGSGRPTKKERRAVERFLAERGLDEE